jgi:hypothetical protein
MVPGGNSAVSASNDGTSEHGILNPPLCGPGDVSSVWLGLLTAAGADHVSSQYGSASGGVVVVVVVLVVFVGGEAGVGTGAGAAGFGSAGTGAGAGAGAGATIAAGAATGRAAGCGANRREKYRNRLIMAGSSVLQRCRSEP